MMKREPVLSRHRLPSTYRISLVILWLMPVVLLTLTIMFSHGLSPSLLDMRLLIPLLLMLIPALYIWHEGVDVLPSGIVARIHWPRYYPYYALDNWHFDHRTHKRVITVWDHNNRKVLECRVGHLTELPFLLDALKSNLRYRNWPI